MKANASDPRGEISLERIEKMLLVCAELVDRRGPIAKPLLDRLEREYLAAKERGTAVDRIRKLIAAD
ncbi:hypothetical protein GOB13_21760 [Sinorhizobium meliloti]|uniref:hypothetical protein n=1 Tax=Rhizobium meliloti TaxID=382 RepID=UPI000B4A5351|nr:hypothetical protein [Sinorhizobium meliloti]ASQ04088.1 hypothetical protein CDO23_09120 [Sinorhizobium meliloti]MDW9519183.1 hypothetical protein [Sinorhizobium meliloti]MDW9632838.1 hypothetical protein [Sinorhizobium meliloti]MDW9842667.1 hypothetical protein [Sinorhizobium meliloti]MDX0009106.1 hypothetical protein [Sinorhizobium meliloti]